LEDFILVLDVARTNLQPLKSAPNLASYCILQPLPCPFCDRIFKQDGRLKEHLKNKHADESLEADAEAHSGEVGSDDQVQPQQQPSLSSYPTKTPKTLLHEWCQKNKRPVPKFKHVSNFQLI
jgi:hypothetical protein